MADPPDTVGGRTPAQRGKTEEAIGDAGSKKANDFRHDE